MQTRLRQQQPAFTWREGTPLGNGRLGAMVCGRAADERILFNHEALFNWSRREPPPETAGALPALRRLLAEGRFAEAERAFPDLFRAAPRLGAKGKFFPAFDLRLRTAAAGAFRDYGRELDLAHGVCTVRWRDEAGAWERTAFVDAARGAAGGFRLRIRRTGAPFSLSLALDRHDLSDYPGYGGWDAFRADAPDAATLFSAVTTNDGLDFRGVLRLLSTDGAVRTEAASPAGLPRLSVSGATRLDLFVDVSDRPIALSDFAPPAALAPFDEALAAHAAAFSERFSACRLSLGAAGAESAPAGRSQSAPLPLERTLLDAYAGAVPTALVEAAAAFGRYLLLSSSGFGCALPANLQGLWNGDYTPGWGSCFFLNENVQMAYWQALAGGLPETLLPLFDLMERLAPDFRENARRLYGCRGVLLPVFLDDRNGFKDNAQPHVVYWTAGGAWVAALYFDYWRHTLDEAFLRDRAYPFLAEAALFYEDFLAPGPDGRPHFAPAVSPENRPLGAFEGAGTLSVSVDPTMDVALARELFTNLLAAAERLGLDADLAPRRRAVLAALPPYETNGRGALREWLHPALLDNDRHRHLSHLYPLFPGREISARRTPALFEAARRAALARRDDGLADQSGWSLAHLACVWARLGEGDRALECLELLLRCCVGPNLLAHHNDWRGMGVTLEMLHGGRPLFQADANFGFAAAVQEMLLQADDAELRLLPARPAAWTHGRAEGLRAPGRLRVDLAWDETGLCATLLLDPAAPPRAWRLAAPPPYAPAPDSCSLSPGIPFSVRLPAAPSLRP